MEMDLEKFDKLNKIEIGRGIRHLRKSNRMSIQTLADVTETQKYWISNLENGKINFSFLMLNKLLFHFNITFIEFLEILKESNETTE